MLPVMQTQTDSADDLSRTVLLQHLEKMQRLILGYEALQSAKHVSGTEFHLRPHVFEGRTEEHSFDRVRVLYESGFGSGSSLSTMDSLRIKGGLPCHR